jgi:4-amino-4-deoxy-L-arabinose transferase-like glycosyltransferase
MFQESRSSRHYLPAVAAVLLLVILCVELALTARQESQTSDEAAHILAGYRSWKNADFGINPEHPPLVKLVATLPLLHLPIRITPLPQGYFRGVELLGGKTFLYSNDANLILLRSRLAAAIFTFGLAVAVFFSAWSDWGLGPALLALALLVFEPNILAHGALVATDMGVTFGLFLTVAAYSAYLRRRSVWRLVSVGAATGIALATKHSGILVVPILVFLAGVEWWLQFRAAPEEERKLRFAAWRTWQIVAPLAAIFAIALILLWASYGFRYSARPAGLQLDPPFELYASQVHGVSARLLLGAARRKLFPESYLYGLIDVVGLSTPIFFFGQFYTRGQWFYFPSLLLIKSTVGFLLLLFLLPLAKSLFRRGQLRASLFLVVPTVFYFLVAMSSAVNMGVRHILPIYPFLIVLTAAAAWNLLGRSHVCAVLVTSFLVFHIVSSVRAFPTYIPYSNEIWGGPAKTYEVLSDSNTDWAQGLNAMQRYLDQKKIRDCWFAYTGAVTIDTSYYGIGCKPLPTSFERVFRASMPVIPAAIDGPLFLSVSETSAPLWGSDEANPYAAFRHKFPAAVIAGSILVFEGKMDISAAAAITHESAALHLTESGDLDRALDEAEQAIALAPNSVDAHVARGNVLARMKRDADATQEFELARGYAAKIQFFEK